jgi:hypothetical protein
VSGSTGKQVYDPRQLAAGWRSMALLASLIHRGGRPVPVAPTISLAPGEEQYGWFPVDVSGAGRELTVITDRRLILGADQRPLAAITSIEPDPAGYAMTLRFRNAEPVHLRGPWVPWLGVVLSALLHGTAFPPEQEIPLPMAVGNS